MAAYGGNGYGNDNNRYGAASGNRYDNPSGGGGGYGQMNDDRYGSSGGGMYNQPSQTGAYQQPSTGMPSSQGRTQPSTGPYGGMSQQSGNRYGDASQSSANPYGNTAQQASGPYGGTSQQPSQGRYAGGYGGQQQQSGSAAYAGRNDIEMGAMTGHNSAGSQAVRGDPKAILDECTNIVLAIEAKDEDKQYKPGTIEYQLQRLRSDQARFLDSAGGQPAAKATANIDRLGSETMTLYRSLVGRMKAIKQQPASGDPLCKSHVGATDRRLKAAINEYQQVDRDFRHQLQDQAIRQYTIVNPDATPEEKREVAENTSNTQIFSQALMTRNRRGESSSALSAVRTRHDAIQNIERQMIELAQLFQDMEATVIQQEPAVQNIDDKAEDTVQNLDKGNQQLSTAVVSARAARRKKWICLGICILIVLIIVAIVVIVVEVLKSQKH